MSGLVRIESPFGALTHFTVEPGTTLQDIRDRAAPTEMPLVIVRDEVPVLRKDWGDLVQTGQHIRLIILPGKGGAKDIFKIVALLALAIAAPYAGAALFGAGTLGASVASATLLVGGSLLINALFPAQQNKPLSISTSPTYSVSSQGNQARLLQVIPRQYGRHIIYPDFAAQPWGYYDNNEQYLCEFFSLGVGLTAPEEVRIGSTTIWTALNGKTRSYADLELKFYGPGEKIDLFHTDVITSLEVQGLELIKLGKTAPFTITGDMLTGGSGTGDDITFLGNFRVGMEVVFTGDPASYFVIDVDAQAGTFIQFDRAPSFQGAVTVQFTNNEFMGPYIVSPPDRPTDRIEFDFVFPSGLYQVVTDDDGKQTINYISVQAELQIQEVDDVGLPVGPWIVLDNHSFSFARPDTQRVTLGYAVALGRYQARSRRLSITRYDPAYQNGFQWVGLKGFIPGPQTFSEVSTMAVRIRASNQMSSAASRQFGVIQTAIIPEWDGTSWSEPRPSRSIAWALADVARNQEYGGGLPDVRIDLSKLLELDATWRARGDTFDGIFDTRYSVLGAIEAVATVGRSRPVQVGGLLTFVRDEPKQIPRAVFSPLNIRPASFNVSHIMNDTESADDIILTYIDERTWKPAEVECRLAGSDSDNPSRQTSFGMVNRAQVWRSGIYTAAVNRYRRVAASFDTELEGKLLIIGDMIAINHDLPNWGQHGSLLGIDVSGRRLASTEPFREVPGRMYAALRRRDGKTWGPVLIQALQDEGRLVVLDVEDLALVEASQGPAELVVNQDYTEAGDPAHILVSSEEKGTYARTLKVANVAPQDDTQVTIAAVVDDPRVYSAELTSTPPSNVTLPPSDRTGPTVASLVLTKVGTTIKSTWSASGSSYQLQYSLEGTLWRDLYTGPLLTYTAAIPGTTFRVRVSADGGPWNTVTKTF